MRRIFALTLFLATTCYALGITLPLVRIERLWIFEEEPSLVQMIASLWNGEDRLLAVFVGLFSVAAPAAKLALLHVAIADSDGKPLPAWFRAIARWSMLDVVLVAIVIFAVKTSGLASAVTKPGLWFFAASVFLTAGASTLAQKQQKTGRPD